MSRRTISCFPAVVVADVADVYHVNINRYFIYIRI